MEYNKFGRKIKMAKFNRTEVKPELTKVVSSTLAAVGYDKPKEHLIVEFKGGSQYLYKKVPQQTFDALMSAVSHGKYFHANVKNIFEFVKIKQGIKKEKKEEKPKEIPIELPIKEAVVENGK
jgi:hypothetical protein